jgi:TM2 domain-containing membrane protein YozV
MSKALVIIINLFVPGLGTLFIGKIIQALFQLALTILGWLLMFSVLFSFIGLGIYGISWIWALIVGIQYQQRQPAPTGIQSSSSGIGKRIS